MIDRCPTMDFNPAVNRRPTIDHLGTMIKCSPPINCELKNRIDYPTPWGLGDTGLYARHLSKWLKFDDRKNLLAIAYDKLKQDPKNVQRRVREFLGFNFPGSIAIENSNLNEAKVKHPSCYAQTKLNSIFEPMNQELYRLLNQNPGPTSEQTPFPSFIQLECDERDVHSSMQVKNTEGTSIVLPNILLIGAQKAGTSAIGGCLLKNGVCRLEVFKGELHYYAKEVQFFDQKRRYEQGLEFYAKRYQHCNSSTFAMDATPNTLSFPEHVESVYRAAGGDHLKNV